MTQRDAHGLAAMGDRDAARSLARGRFAHERAGTLYLHGLGGRDASTQLGGLRLAVPAVGALAFPFELVPAGVVGAAPQIIGGAHLHNVYTPDLPGQFRGGIIDLDPGALVSEPTLELAVAGGVRTRTTIEPGRSYDGGALDFLGIDDGTRSLPGAAGSAPLQPRPAQAQRVRLGEELGGVWAADRTVAPPDVAFAARAGDGWGIGSTALRAHMALYYLNAHFTNETVERELVFTPMDVIAGDPATTEQTLHAVRLAAALRLRFDYAPGQALESHTWLARGADDLARVGDVRADGTNARSTATALVYVERQIFAQQLRSEHRLGAGDAPRLRVDYGYSLASWDEPDRREHVVSELSSGQMTVSSAERSFSEATDSAHDIAVELRATLLRADATLLEGEVGGAVLLRDGELGRRRFIYDLAISSSLPIEELLAPEASGDAFFVDEVAMPGLTSAMRIYAGYGLLDGEIGPISAFSGVRLERWSLDVEDPVGEQIAGPTGPTRADAAHTAAIPAAQLAVRASQAFALRGAWSLTVDRPEPFELAPWRVGRSDGDAIGNSELAVSRQHNADLGARIELESQRAEGGDALDALDALDATIGYRHFTDPIHALPVFADGPLQLANGEEAWLWTLSFGIDKRLDFIAPSLAAAYVSGNAAVTLDSGEELASSVLVVEADRMLGVPTFLLDLRIAYDPGRGGGRPATSAAIAYRAIGPVVAELDWMGVSGRRTTTQHQLDLYVSHPLGHGFRLALAAHNLLDLPVELTRSDHVISSTHLGRTLELGLSWAASANE